MKRIAGEHITHGLITSPRGRLAARLCLCLAALTVIAACAPRTASACPPPSLPAQGTVPDKPGSANTLDPVDIYDGAALEEATDIILPGVTGAWSFTRQYSSELPGGTYILGTGWKCDSFTAFCSGNTGNVTVYLDHLTKRTFTESGGTYTPPEEWPAELTHDTTNHYFVLKDTHTGETRTFYDGSASWPDHQRGVLKSITDRNGKETVTYTYDYSDTRRITMVVTTQMYAVLFTYIDAPGGVLDGKISQIDVRASLGGSYVYLQRVKYTYLAGGNYNADCGSDGDLIRVEVLRKGTGDSEWSASDTGFSIRRVTMYRYYNDDDDDGLPHELKMVLSPASVEKAMADAGTSDSTDLLELGDSDDVIDGVTQLQDYANVIYTYYTAADPDFATSNILGSDGGVGGDNEDLQTKYGGANLVETGFVKSQTVRKDYRGFLGTRTFFYMDNTDVSGCNAASRIVVEDTTLDGANHSGTRKIYGLNSDRQMLREVFVNDPKAETPKYWCTSFWRGAETTPSNNYNRILEKRMPSVHACIDTDDDVEDFLDVDAVGEWDNGAIMNDTSGVVYTYAYDANSHLIEEKVKQGREGSEYYLRAVEYGDGTEDTDYVPDYLPWKTHEYHTATTTKETDSARFTTTTTYDFHDEDGQQMKTKTVSRELVPTSANGSGAAIVTKEYYDDRGRLRWTKDGEGHVNYYSYHGSTGGLSYVMVDVRTDALPTAITAGGTRGWPGWQEILWVAWSGAAPTGFEHTDTGSLMLVTKYEYDKVGRQVKTEDPLNVVTAIAYRDNETRVYPGWKLEGMAYVANLPIRIEKVNDDDLTVQTYTINPAGITAGYNELSHLPTGVDTGEAQEDYLTWTRYGYYDDASEASQNTALLKSVDRYYYNISGGTGTLSTNFYRTFYRYDVLGRRTHAIEVVSGTDSAGLTGCVEQIVKTNYDALGRVESVERGVSGSSHVMKTDYLYDTDPTDPPLKKVLANYYDQSTPGTGSSAVGDGLRTSSLGYYDDNSIDEDHSVKTIYHHDWRGRLRGIEPEDPPYTVQDVDNLGRVKATAQFVTEPTWTGVGGVVETEDYAADATDTSRRTLTKTSYDEMGRVYATEVYAVTDEGVLGDRVHTDNYYDRNSRLVATTSPGRGATEYAYDGAGRRTEVRAAKALRGSYENEDYYDSGAFHYCDPQPAATSGGNEWVVEIARTVYDAAGNVTKTITMELNDGDTDGLSLTDHDFVRTFVYRWYDPDTHQLMTTADYGVGGTTWTYTVNEPTYATYANRPTSSNSSCLVTVFAYDVAARLETITDPMGVPTKYAYDALGRQTKVEEADGKTTERWTLLVYDGLSNVTQRIADLDKDGSDAGDQVTTYTYYDVDRSPYRAGLLTRTKYPDGDDTDDNVDFTYFLDGKTKTRTDQRGTEITFDYDAKFRRLEKQRVTNPGGVDETVLSLKTAYDSLGRVEKVTSYSDDDCTTAVNEVQYAYNDLGALEKEYQAHTTVVDTQSTPCTPYVEYGYDNSDTDDNGIFDKAMRLKSVRYPNTRVVHYLYTDPSASNPYETDGLGDAISRVTALAKDTGRGQDDANVHAAYVYNGASRLVEAAHPNVGADGLNLIYRGSTAGTYSGFDRFGRVVDQKWQDTATPTPAVKDRFTYGYDYNSNRLWRDNVVASAASQKFDEQYIYDDLNRLTTFRRGVLDYNHVVPASGSNCVRREAWGLSATGNWSDYQIDANGDGDYADATDLDQDRTHSIVNEIDTDNDHADGRDEGAITESAGSVWLGLSYDACGNVKIGPKPAAETTRHHYVYDAWNRLVEVKADSVGTPGTPGDTIAEYRYDGLNRRIAKIVKNGATWDRTDFYYSVGWQVLEERFAGAVSSENRVNVATAARFQYVWDPRYVDAPVLRDEDTNSNGNCTDDGGSERLYYTQDANFNTTALVNTSGTVVECYVYDPYGKVTIYNGGRTSTVSWTNSKKNAVLFCGYRYDPESVLYHVRNRVYHPTLGRWLQRDPLGYVDGMSLCEYVGGTPVGATDPSGQYTQDLLYRYPGTGGMIPIPLFIPGMGQNILCLEKPVIDGIAANLRWWEAELRSSAYINEKAARDWFRDDPDAKKKLLHAADMLRQEADEVADLAKALEQFAGPDAGGSGGGEDMERYGANDGQEYQPGGPHSKLDEQASKPPPVQKKRARPKLRPRNLMPPLGKEWNEWSDTYTSHDDKYLGDIGTGAAAALNPGFVPEADHLIPYEAGAACWASRFLVPMPPGWDKSWKWEPPSGEKPGAWRWWDPKGGEWRYHAPDKWHPGGHYDYNPWDNWNSEWRNIPLVPKQTR